MNSKELIKDISDFCNANFNENNIFRFSRYFKGGFKGYGVPTELFNKKVHQIQKTPAFDLRMLYEIAPSLLGTGMYEEGSFAIMLLKGFKKQFSKDVFHEVRKWFQYGIDNWAHADTLGMFILPDFLLKGIVEPVDFQPWIASGYKFQRRVVPVTFIKWLKAHKEMPFTPLFALITPLMRDPEREVHQGTGWFLREAWKIRPEETEDFLMKWKDQSPRLIFQYACEKMNREGKERFRRRKK